MLTCGGASWSSGSVVGRGGRDAVEDERGGSGHHSPRREWLRGHGAPGMVSTYVISGWRSGGDEFDRSPCGYGELDAGDGTLPRMCDLGRGILGSVEWWCCARRQPGCSIYRARGGWSAREGMVRWRMRRPVAEREGGRRRDSRHWCSNGASPCGCPTSWTTRKVELCSGHSEVAVRCPGR